MNTASQPSGRIRAILRKDLQLLWPLGALSALLQVLLGVVQHHSSPFTFGRSHMALVALVTLATVISMVLVIAISVQLDPIPGTSQDWVTRPVRRRDLLLAKLLTLAVLIHGPIIAVQILQGLSEGFQFGSVLSAALLSNFYIAMLFTLPVTAIAAMTRTLGEAIIGSLAVLVGFIVIYLLIVVLHNAVTGSWSLGERTGGLGVQWVWRSLSDLWLLVLSIGVLMLQYLRRSTLRARVLFVAGMLVFTFLSYLPWRAAFAVQKWVGPRARSERVSIAFDAGASKAGVEAGPAATGVLLVRGPSKAGRDGKSGGKLSPGWVRVVLPFRVSGLPAGSILHADHETIRVRGVRGTVYRAVSAMFDLRARADGSAVLGQIVELPRAAYAKAVHQPLRVTIGYSLTILGEHAVRTLPANGAGRLPDVGHCADRVDTDGKALDVACMTVGAEPACLSMTLVVRGIRHGPRIFRCRLNYAPAALRFSASPIARFQSRLPLPSSGAAESADQSLVGARVKFTLYEPEAHFSRRVVAQGVRLAQWREASGPSHERVPAPPTRTSSRS